jgi:DNA-binding Lrp family transcriptional regulator
LLQFFDQTWAIFVLVFHKSLSKFHNKIYKSSTANNNNGEQPCSYFDKVVRMKVRSDTTALDDLDWSILQLLQSNANQTYAQMGRQLKVAHSTIYERIKRMEEAGVVKKYTVTVDLEKVGKKPITAIMTVFADPKETEEVAKKLALMKEAIEVNTSLSEELLIIAKVVAEDQEKLHEFIAQKVVPLQGVLRIRTSIVTKKFKEGEFPIECLR